MLLVITNHTTGGDLFGVSLEISYGKELLQICIRNSCLRECKKNGEGRYLTTKEDAVHHGIGLSSMEQAVARYHGEVSISDTDGEFKVTVVMYGSSGKITKKFVNLTEKKIECDNIV